MNHPLHSLLDLCLLGFLRMLEAIDPEGDDSGLEPR